VRSRLDSALALRASSLRFHCPAVFAASHNSKCIVGRRLGLLGFYRCGALIATEVFAVKVAELAGRGESYGAYDRSGRMLIGRSVGSAAAQDKQVTNDQYAELQKNFAEAYNRKNADAMAAAFAEDGIRVTPSGIFRGRDAIHRNLQDVLNMGLRDYTVQRTVSRAVGTFVFNAGEWRAKLGDQPLLHRHHCSRRRPSKDHGRTVTIVALGH
jgi:ketosteroid isomerase-like protein